MNDLILWFDQLGMDDVETVGGKNASLGEMIQGLSSAGVSVPGGFATTAHAYRQFLAQNNLGKRINAQLSGLDVNNVNALAEVGKSIRQWVLDTEFPDDLREAIVGAYKKMQDGYKDEFTVAVRSSATAEDLPDASFAGQQETILNVSGIDNVLHSIKEVFASLYNDRAISYRVHKNFEHHNVYLSAGIQRMIRSDLGSSGVMFTMDTESGFRDVVFITAAYGLGETVVQGSVNPDEFYVHKPGLLAGRPAVLSRKLGSKAIKMIYDDTPDTKATTCIVDVDVQAQQCFCLNDQQIQKLAGYAVSIEKHYGQAMDIEWAIDGKDNSIHIVQARPETVKSNSSKTVIERYQIKRPGEVLISGRAIGQRIGSGAVRVVNSINQMDEVKPGDVLVTDMTDPDWEPIMKRASAIVTNRGGRTCHAAIIARELGIPAVVGCGDATEVLKDVKQATVSCAEGDTGIIYRGIIEYNIETTDTGEMPKLPTKIMMNIGNPGRAFDFNNIPSEGVGLARLEFVINTTIGIHPKALLYFENQSAEIKKEILQRSAGYASPVEFYVEKLVEGIATLGATFTPRPVIVRMSDFKSNEYANLFAGDQYEPTEENPMIGFRGTSRYLSEDFRPCFELECRALKKVRDEMGLVNVEIMVPFCRTLGEAKQVIELLAANGLRRGENGLRVIMMCEIPSNAVMAEEFLEYFDGFSIGSNDMTQLMLGLDRDSGLVSHLFDERDPAVKKILHMAIKAAQAKGKYIGICGQGPSDFPDFARWLLDEGISSMSLNPDTVVKTWMHLAGDPEEAITNEKSKKI